MTAGAQVPVSIRQHDVALATTAPLAGTGNHIKAVVKRQVFLGASRDYLLALADGSELRLSTGAGQNVPTGTTVWLHLPPECCLALAR